MGFSCINCKDFEYGICPDCLDEEKSLPRIEMTKDEFDRKINSLIKKYFNKRKENVSRKGRTSNLQKNKPGNVGSRGGGEK